MVARYEMKKVLGKILGVGAVFIGGVLVASEQPVAPALGAGEARSERTHENLWLTGKKSDNVVTIALSSYPGLARHFLSTGLYDMSVFGKGFTLTVDSPSCTRCVPHGFFSAIDIEGYFTQSPVWVGVRGLGGGFGMHRHLEAQAPAAAKNDSVKAQPSLSIKQPVTAIILSPSYALGATFGGKVGGLDMNVSIEPVGLALNGAREIPTSHVRLCAEMYGYTAPLRYKALAARLFAGWQVKYGIPGENLEYQLTVSPGATLLGMLGFQGALSFVRFGSAYQSVWQSGVSEASIDVVAYSHPARPMVGGHRERDAVYSTQQSTAGAFSPAVASVKHLITSYLAATLGQCTLGISTQSELGGEERQSLLGTIRVTAGFVF